MRKLRTKIVVVAAGAMIASACFAGAAFAAGESTGDMPAYPPYIDQPAKKTLIGKKAAKRIAFDDAGVAKRYCSEVSINLRKRSGKKVYVVKFTYKGVMEYRYTVKARNGKILAYWTKHV